MCIKSCGGVFHGQGATVLSGSAQGVGQQEPQGDKRDNKEGDEVKGDVEEIRSNTHSAHET